MVAKEVSQAVTVTLSCRVPLNDRPGIILGAEEDLGIVAGRPSAAPHAGLPPVSRAMTGQPHAAGPHCGFQPEVHAHEML